MKNLTNEIQEKQKDISNSDMRIEIREDYYNIMRQDDINHSIFLPEARGMYVVDIHKNYYSEDEQAVLHDMIEDIEEKLEMLKEIYKNRYEEQYKSIGKRIKKDELER